MGFTNSPPTLVVTGAVEVTGGNIDSLVSGEVTAIPNGAVAASGAYTVNPIAISVALPAYARTIDIVVNFSPTLTPAGPTVTVVGTTSGFEYFSGPASAFTGQRAFYMAPVNPSLDAAVTVSIFAGASVATPISAWVTLDSNDDRAERFINNGVGQALNRSDNLPYPLGQKAALASVSTGSGTLIGAPGASVSILLTSLRLTPPATMAATGTGQFEAFGTIGGTSQPLIFVYATAASLNAPGIIPADIKPQGRLLDGNTALTYSSTALPGAGVWNLAAEYDLVPTPLP